MVFQSFNPTPLTAAHNFSSSCLDHLRFALGLDGVAGVAGADRVPTNLSFGEALPEEDLLRPRLDAGDDARFGRFDSGLLTGVSCDGVHTSLRFNNRDPVIF